MINSYKSMLRCALGGEEPESFLLANPPNCLTDVAVVSSKVAEREPDNVYVHYEISSVDGCRGGKLLGDGFYEHTPGDLNPPFYIGWEKGGDPVMVFDPAVKALDALPKKPLATDPPQEAGFAGRHRAVDNIAKKERQNLKPTRSVPPGFADRLSAGRARQYSASTVCRAIETA